MSAAKLESPLEKHAHRIVWGLSVGWTVLVAISLSWNLQNINNTAIDLARVGARASFTKDVVYRVWSAGHGGVYVPTTSETPPNPYLAQVEERDLTTPSGRALTLVNPAYMTRQVHELGAKRFDLQSHITSLNPIRPENAPDAWEEKALQAFSNGQSEVSEVTMRDGQPHIRLMRPLLAEKICLKCHAPQGYREGDIRGGISVAVALQPYKTAVWTHALPLILSHGLIWLVGLVAFYLGGAKIKEQFRLRFQDEVALKESEEQYRTLIKTSMDGVWWVDLQGWILQVNDAYCRMSGYTEAELLSMHIWDVEALETRIEILTSVQKIMAAGYLRFESKHRRRDGSLYDIEVSAQYLPVSGGRIVAFLRDITDHKLAEEALRSKVAELERVNNLMIGRENRMIELKWEINELCRQINLPPRYTTPGNISLEAESE